MPRRTSEALSLPRVLLCIKAMPYRREQQFVLPLTVRIKLAIGLTVAQPLQAKTDLRAAEWLAQTVSQPDPLFIIRVVVKDMGN